MSLKDNIIAGRVILLQIKPITYMEKDIIDCEACSDSSGSSVNKPAVWHIKTCRQRSVMDMNPKPCEWRVCKRCMPTNVKLIRSKTNDQDIFLASQLHVRLKYRRLVDALESNMQLVNSDYVLRDVHHSVAILGISVNKYTLQDAWDRLLSRHK